MFFHGIVFRTYSKFETNREMGSSSDGSCMRLFWKSQNCSESYHTGMLLSGLTI